MVDTGEDSKKEVLHLNLFRGASASATRPAACVQVPRLEETCGPRLARANCTRVRTEHSFRVSLCVCLSMLRRAKAVLPLSDCLLLRNANNTLSDAG